MAKLSTMADVSVTICKFLMKMFPAIPDPFDPHLWEVFKTDHYVNGMPKHQKEIRYNSAIASYNSEQNREDSWLKKYFFSRLNEKELEGKILLDLGCFTGGRLVSWTEQYNLKRGLGLDINPIFKLAGDEFALSLGLDKKIEFKTGHGEELPYADASIDFIIATDVFEHVRNVEVVMKECQRVLKKGGKLCVVFPQYYQPLEAHIGMVTKTPALHWMFSGDTISRAYVEIINDREDADWYMPERFPLSDWEKLPELNGITIRKFKKIIDGQEWSRVNSKVKPILTDGRKSKQLKFKILSLVFAPLAHIPFLNELFTGRINYIFTK